MIGAFLCGIYSGAVAGVRDAFIYGIIALAISYDWHARIFLL